MTILSSARLDGVDEWAPFLIYLATVVALVVGGGYLVWSKWNDHDDPPGRGVKIAYGAITAALPASIAVTIIQAAAG